ncbi:hypothetical protein Hte_004776 [Hypoxylon texense]
MPCSYPNHPRPTNGWAALGQACYHSASQWSTEPFYPPETMPMPKSSEDEEMDAPSGLDGLPTPRVTRATEGVSFADYLPNTMREEPRTQIWFERKKPGFYYSSHTDETSHPLMSHPPRRRSSPEAMLASIHAREPALSREVSRQRTSSPATSTAQTTTSLHAPVPHELKENLAFFPLTPRPRRIRQDLPRDTTAQSYPARHRYVGEPSLPGQPRSSRREAPPYPTSLTGNVQDEDFIPLSSSGSPTLSSRTTWSGHVAGWPPRREQGQDAQRETTTNGTQNDDEERSHTAVPSVEDAGGQQDAEQDAGHEVSDDSPYEPALTSSPTIRSTSTAPAAPQSLRVPKHFDDHEHDADVSGEEEDLRQVHRRRRSRAGGVEDWAEMLGRVAATTKRLIFVVEGNCQVDLSSPTAVVDEPLVVHVRGNLHIGTTAEPGLQKQRKRKSDEEENDGPAKGKRRKTKTNHVEDLEEDAHGGGGGSGRQDENEEDACEEDPVTGRPARLKRRYSTSAARRQAYTPSCPIPSYFRV